MHRFPLSSVVPDAPADPTDVAGDARIDREQDKLRRLEHALRAVLPRHIWDVQVSSDDEGVLYGDVTIRFTFRCDGDELLALASYLTSVAGLIANQTTTTDSISIADV